MSDFIIQIEKLITAFGDAEYRYLLLEPLIFYGILIGVVMLGVGFFMKAPKLQFAALITIGISAFAHVPYKEARLSAAPRMEQVYKISSPARMKGFNENTQTWLETVWQFRLLVLLAAVTLMIGINRNRFGFGLGVATCLLGLLVAKNAMWLHYQDAIAYHPNLKKHEAPIDRQPRIQTPPAVTQSQWTPESVDTTRVAPAAAAPATMPLSTRPPSSAGSTFSRGRIPPPEVPIRPRARAVTPMAR
ncbi:MAG: hypothetical protein P1U58_04495 [Verrucomicrobiales bacterium]|nr:hypothetical protein [Verrucomicrobiales bacterium]